MRLFFLLFFVVVFIVVPSGIVLAGWYITSNVLWGFVALLAVLLVLTGLSKLQSPHKRMESLLKACETKEMREARLGKGN